MEKVCDVCGKKLGFRKFKYQEGMICKECYQKASKNFTETITMKSKAEIMALCGQPDSEKEDWGDFECTGKIGNYILFDDKHHKLCITHNRFNEKEMQEAEVISYDNLKRIDLYCEPTISREELADMVAQRKDQVIQLLEIRLWTFSEPGMKKIVLLSTAARAKSFSFRKVFGFAEKILDKLNEVKNQEK